MAYRLRALRQRPHAPALLRSVHADKCSPAAVSKIEFPAGRRACRRGPPNRPPLTRKALSRPDPAKHLRQNPWLEVVPLPSEAFGREVVQAVAAARAFRRITCGGCPKARRKARRMRSRSAKPVCRAMTSIG